MDGCWAQGLSYYRDNHTGFLRTAQQAWEGGPERARRASHHDTAAAWQQMSQRGAEADKES